MLLHCISLISFKLSVQSELNLLVEFEEIQLFLLHEIALEIINVLSFKPYWHLFIYLFLVIISYSAFGYPSSYLVFSPSYRGCCFSSIIGGSSTLCI